MLRSRSASTLNSPEGVDTGVL